MFLFANLAWPIVLLFSLASCVIVATFASSLVLLYLSRSGGRHCFYRPCRAMIDTPNADPEDYAWVFLVPAMNEEVTIADSVRRLAEVRARNHAILVIDDGSQDKTPEILAGMSVETLEVLRRDKPNAQLGKAAALNDAYHHVHRKLLAPGGRFDGWSPDRVVIAVVDADGRLDPAAPRLVMSHFVDPQVGGVQVSVKIYNRSHPLAWMQHAEFGIIGRLQQLGRSRWGTAGMGGNGQFNRLSALDSIVGSGPGPWRDTLTEDQDLGLRLIAAGWKNEHDDRVCVEQQGLSNIRRLYRQRTRWAQGNLQALMHLRSIARARHISVAARSDLLLWLVTPILQLWVGMCSLVAIALALTGVPLIPDGEHYHISAIVVVSLALGATLMGLIARSRSSGPLGFMRAIVLAVPYALYAWFMWPVLIGAVLRHIRGATTWAKTDREPLGAQPVPQAATASSEDEVGPFPSATPSLVSRKISSASEVSPSETATPELVRTASGE